MDGRYAWADTAAVFDAKTRKLVATLKVKNRTFVAISTNSD